MPCTSTPPQRNKSTMKFRFLLAMQKCFWFSVVYVSLALCCQTAIGQVTIFVGIKPLDIGPFENIQDAFQHIQENSVGFPEGPISVVAEPGDYCESLSFPTVEGVALISSDPSVPSNFTIKNATCSQDNADNPLVHTIRGFRVSEFEEVNDGVSVGPNCTLNIDQCDVNGDFLIGISAFNGGVVNITNTSIRLLLGTGLGVFGNSQINFNGGDIAECIEAFLVGSVSGETPPELNLGGGTVITGNMGSGSVIGENAIVNVDDVELIANGAGFLVENAGPGGGGESPGPNQGGLVVTITNSTFRGTSTAEGGAITSTGNVDLSISNCLFESNSNTGVSTGSGAAVQLTETSATIMNCTFRDNLSNKGAGAIQCDDGADATVSDCHFENNHSDGSFDEGAGAIVCDASSPLILDSTFVSNTARVEAGAIRIANGASPQIQNCMFTGNVADRIAGAVFCQGNSIPMFVGCSFQSNMTTNVASDGGAVVGEGASPSFHNCSFQDNLSPDVGAALMEDSSSFPANVTFTGCSFSGNLGGTMEAFDATLNLVECQFDNNLEGNVVACFGSNTTMEDCHFDSNAGRAIFVNDSSSNPSAMDVTNCSFNNHVAELDGATVFAFDTAAGFANCTFTNNSSSPNGGALLMVNSDLVLKYCHLENNIATELGGAVGCFNGTNGTFIGCFFAGNSCGVDGGAVFCSSSATASYQSCAFSGNSSGNDGGALVTSGLPGDTISNCTFADNVADNQGGVVIADGDTALIIDNSILWENGSNPIQVQSGSTANVSFSNVQGGFAGTGNLNTDPLFTNAAGEDGITGTLDDDLSLQPNSPMIDAGDNEAVPVDEFDVDVDGDIGEPMPLDLKKMIRFVDNPDVNDTGNGVAPVVDIGAIEFSILLLGDVNLDGAVNLLDVGPFVERLSQGVFQAEADCNQDGQINLLDVGPFIELLSGV